MLMNLFSHKADLTGGVASRYRCRKLQLTAEALGDPSVAAHGVVAHETDLLIAATLFLPGLHQRTVMEVDIQMIVVTALYIHFENPLREL